MTTPDHDELKHRRRWPTYLAVVLILLLVVYPLSIGPMSVVCHYANADFVWAWMYLPVVLIGHAAGGNEALFAYINWWLDVGGTDTFMDGGFANADRLTSNAIVVSPS